jgi:hypothetical protein
MKGTLSGVTERLRKLHRRHPTATGMVAGLVAAVTVWFVIEYRGDQPPAVAGEVLPLGKSGLQPRDAVPGNPAQTMRPAVASVLGFEGEAPLRSRVRELMVLREALNGDEIEELLRALLGSPMEGRTQGEDSSTWFHEVANVLHRQATPPRAFAEVLATVAGDGKRNLVVRDYALQHLRRVWSSAAADPGLMGSIEATLELLAETPGELRPTALLSLHLLDPRGRGGLDDGVVVRAVTAALKPSATSESVGLRMVAARICGERNLAPLRPALMAAASSESEHALVRMSAVAALGRIGIPEDLDALASLSPGDGRVATAIAHATSGNLR